MVRPCRLCCVTLLAMSLAGPTYAAPSAGEKVRAALTDGRIALKLSTPEALAQVLGAPDQRAEPERDGGQLLLRLQYGGVKALFARSAEEEVPFTLRRLVVGDRVWRVGDADVIHLRDRGDLARLDRFNGYQRINLDRLDLRGDLEVLARVSFDTLTRWPAADRLPPGFDPARRIEHGRNPGLGVRTLHAAGLDGRGVGLAIIDQPLLLGHREYADRVVRYDASGMLGIPPQMHGPPVTSIAVGATLGVAPRAELSYFAVPMWTPDNRPMVAALERILELNRTLPEGQKPRVVSVSTGMFPSYAHHDAWKQMRDRAEAQGVLVVTCDSEPMLYGALTRLPGGDPDDPKSWAAAGWARKGEVLRVPTTRTIASYRGPDVYTFDFEGGLSWAAPYLAGLGAIAFQIDRRITPARIRALLVSTATKTDAGAVVDPGAFVAAVKRGVPKR